MNLLLWNVLFAAIPLILVIVIGVALFVIARRRPAESTGGEGQPSRTAGIARVVAVVAFVYGVAAAVGSLMAAVVVVSSAAQGSHGGNAVTLPVPASTATAIPDSVLPPFDLGGELVSYGHFSEVSITGFGMSSATALLVFAPMILTPLLHAIVAFGIASLAKRIELNEGFAPQLAKTAVVVGTSLIVIGSLSQVLETYGTILARHEILGGSELGGWIGPGPVDLTHVAAGAGILLVAVLLKRGEQLQNDTKGLV